MSFISNDVLDISQQNISSGSHSLIEKNKQISHISSSKIFFSDPKQCLFCPKLSNFHETFLMLNKALFLKYSSSQNYYYTKDIQDLVDNSRKPHVISFKDNILLEENEEYLTRHYKSSEHKGKLSYLTEYYKFHKEVPRLFMQPASNAINHFHDKKRRIEYYKIKKMLAEQKKGVIVTGNKDQDQNISESEALDSSMQNSKDKKTNDNGHCEKLVSRILENLDTSLNKSNHNIPENNNDKLKKKFTISKSIKNKNQNQIKPDEKIEKKSVKAQDNSMIALQELNFYLDKLILPPKNEQKELSDDIQTLIPTEISDIFMEDDKTILSNNPKMIKGIKINLEKFQKNETPAQSLISQKETAHTNETINIKNNKPMIPALKNNFFSPKTTIPENLKKNQINSEKLNEKLIVGDRFGLQVQNLIEIKKEQKKTSENSSYNFKKTKSNSINPPKDIPSKTDNVFKNMLSQKNSNEGTHKNAKFFSPDKNFEIFSQKTSDLKFLNDGKLKKVEKFIKIYKNNIGVPVQKHVANSTRDLAGQSKTSSNLSHNNKEISETLQNISKVSNSKSFSEKQNNTKHRRINSSTAMTCKNILKKYQNDVPLEKVQEILFKDNKANNLNMGLKINNSNTLHRKMQSEIFTPKEKTQNTKTNLLISDSKFISNQIMSRSQVNNKIKLFNHGTIHISTIKENLSDLKRGRNKSLEPAKKNEILFSNNNISNKNNIKKSCSTTSTLKDGNKAKNNSIYNLKHNINSRENINPAYKSTLPKPLTNHSVIKNLLNYKY